MSDDLVKWAEKVVDWAATSAERCEREATSTRFETMRDAYSSDAKNLRAIEREGRAAIAKVKKED